MKHSRTQNSFYAIPCIFFLLAIMSLPASLHSAEAQERSLSLRECVEIALEDNLQLQVQSYNPRLALLFADSQIGGLYDPVFSLNYGDRELENPSGSLIPGTVTPIPAFIQESEDYSAQINGRVVTGTRYSFSGNYSTRESWEESNDQIIRSNFSGNFGLTLTQPLLRNGWNIDGKRTVKVNKLAVSQSLLRLEWVIAGVLFDVERTYLNLSSDLERVAVQEKAVELAERLLLENKKRVEIGTMAPLDEKQAEAQLASTKAALLGQRSQLVQTQTRLKNLLSKNYSDWWNVNLIPTEPLAATPLLVDLQTSWANGLELRPDLEDQRLTLEIAGIDLKYAKHQLLPQLDLSSTWRSSAAGTGLRTPVLREGFNNSFDDISSAVSDWESPFWGVNVTLSTPLTLMRERAQYRRQKAANAQSQVILKQNEQNIMVDIENAVTAVQISFQQVSATRQEREFAEAALGAEEKKLEVGKSTSFIVLQLQRDLTTARSNEINALTSYNLNIANLAYLEGRTLDRFDLDMDASAVEREGSDDNAEVNPLLLPYISN